MFFGWEVCMKFPDKELFFVSSLFSCFKYPKNILLLSTSGRNGGKHLKIYRRNPSPPLVPPGNGWFVVMHHLSGFVFCFALVCFFCSYIFPVQVFFYREKSASVYKSASFRLSGGCFPTYMKVSDASPSGKGSQPASCEEPKSLPRCSGHRTLTLCRAPLNLSTM